MLPQSSRKRSTSWNPRLAIGKHTLFAGVGGKGKSQLLYSCAAIVSSRKEWPDGGERNSVGVGSVVLLNAEDGPADMMIPRLISAGATLSNVYFIDAVRDGGDDTGRRRFNLGADLDNLRKFVRDIGDVKLIGVDPLGSYVGAGDVNMDTHNDAKLHNVLDPVNQLLTTLASPSLRSRTSTRATAQCRR